MLETPLLLHQEQQVPHVNSLGPRPQGQRTRGHFTGVTAVIKLPLFQIPNGLEGGLVGLLVSDSLGLEALNLFGFCFQFLFLRIVCFTSRLGGF